MPRKIKAFTRRNELAQQPASLKDILEYGYMKEIVFVWLKQKTKAAMQKFDIGQLESCATEFKAVASPGKRSQQGDQRRYTSQAGYFENFI